jgi:hypothetical protein
MVGAFVLAGGLGEAGPPGSGKAGARSLGNIRIVVALRHHGIAQGLQFLIGDLMEPHPKLENGHGDQLSRIPVGAAGKPRPALFQRTDNRTQQVV